LDRVSVEIVLNQEKENHMSVLDELNKLNATLPTTKKAEPKEERPEMPVPDSVKASLARLLPAQRLAKYCEARIEIENSLVSEEMLSTYAETLWNQGCRPTNPRIVCEHRAGQPDMSGLYQVQEKLKLNYDKGESPVRQRITAALWKAGFNAEAAEKIIEGEIECQPMTVLRPLNELAEGNEVEKAAASKLIKLMVGQETEPFTPEERNVATTKIERVSVRDGFLERVKTYCKNVQELKMLFKVIHPVNFVSHAKFSEDETQTYFEWLVEQGRSIVMGTKLKKK
jgi:hypothetical protein